MKAEDLLGKSWTYFGDLDVLGCGGNGYNILRGIALARPVNEIGSTAEEYARGDFTSAIKRGVERGNPAALLLAKTHEL